MSCVCILTPIVIAGWPAFSSAVVAAATSLGYRVVAESITELQERRARMKQDQSHEIQLEIPQSELVTNQLGRDQKICVTRDGVSVTFSRDKRGRASLCVTGAGHADAALRALGEELSKRVVQKYVYQRLMDEIRARQFVVVEEEVQEDNAIRVKVRHWS